MRNTWDTKTQPTYFAIGEEPHAHPWELYKLDEDYAQAHDVSARYPEKLKELQALFDREAKRNHVYPLHPHAQPYPVGAAGGQKIFTYRAGAERIAPPFGPELGRKAYNITADVEIPSSQTSGVIFAEGGRYSGISLFVDDGHVVVEDNSYGHLAGRIRSAHALAPGKR